MNNEIKIGQTYRHKKGNLYKVIALGRHSETEEEMVGYQGVDDGKVWFRPKAMFAEPERFAPVSSMKPRVIEAFGWYGAAGLIGAYALSSFGILLPESIWYQVINITAALGIVTVSFYKRAYQPGVLNIIWTAIGLVALIKLLS